MPKYIVKSPILHDGKKYEPGETIELSDERAAQMPWAVEPVKEEEKPAAVPPADNGAEQSGAPAEQPVIEKGADTGATSEGAKPEDEPSAEAAKAPKSKKK